MSVLRIGTSGWNYPSGKGSWNGVFYPRPRPKGFNELAFYAEHFDTVEVNSSFYGPPRAEVTRDWNQRTPHRFEFSVKLYQKFTHPQMFKQRIEKTLPVEVRGESALIDTLARPNQADLDEFRRGIDPLASSGKLGALLAQFPASFKDTEPARDYLTDLLRSFGGYHVAVELRHKSWSDRLASTLALLNEFEAAWVQIDEPKFRLSIEQNYLPNVTGFYYMRLHGRNAKNWWHHQNRDDRYDYLYSSSELQEFSETADAARRLVKKLYLYTNNHFSAKSVANAAMLKKQLGEPVPGDYPAELVERYPELAGVVTTPAATLLTPTRRQ
ncbi:MAG TPA: DUF72 domain-containing protein [Vicinamibacterales bacterium]|nr:DUF72 domain-containing protein [Vicinamibacterales bacterium]